MASASMSGVDSFLTQVERVREKIGVKFRRAHQVLLERESALLSELQQIEARYKGEGVAEQIREITASKEQLMATMKGNENQETLKQSVAPLDARIRELRKKWIWRQSKTDWGVSCLSGRENWKEC